MQTTVLVRMEIHILILVGKVNFVNEKVVKVVVIEHLPSDSKHVACITVSSLKILYAFNSSSY